MVVFSLVRSIAIYAVKDAILNLMMSSQILRQLG